MAPDALFAGIPDGSPFYFVHSFAPDPADASVVIGRTEYGRTFTAAVRCGARVGVQFHPERSGDLGLRVLGNFVAICAEAARAA
jgi:glutamine amidotransferase